MRPHLHCFSSHPRSRMLHPRPRHLRRHPSAPPAMRTAGRKKRRTAARSAARARRAETRASRATRCVGSRLDARVMGRLRVSGARPLPSLPSLGPAVLLLAALFGASCDRGGLADSPQDATGETPVRYVICNAKGRACHIYARFTDLDSCNNARRWATAYCDYSEPGQFTCREGDSTAHSYCLPQ